MSSVGYLYHKFPLIYIWKNIFGETTSFKGSLLILEKNGNRRFAQRICVQLGKCLLGITGEIVVFYFSVYFVKCILCFTRCKLFNCNKFAGRVTFLLLCFCLCFPGYSFLCSAI